VVLVWDAVVCGGGAELFVMYEKALRMLEMGLKVMI
jgi:hypothetical protein